jgi:hypothetical protein
MFYKMMSWQHPLVPTCHEKMARNSKLNQHKSEVHICGVCSLINTIYSKLGFILQVGSCVVFEHVQPCLWERGHWIPGSRSWSRLSHSSHPRRTDVEPQPTFSRLNTKQQSHEWTPRHLLSKSLTTCSPHLDFLPSPHAATKSLSTFLVHRPTSIPGTVDYRTPPPKWRASTLDIAWYLGTCSLGLVACSS